ncbi:hypothetical protein FRC00_005250 [Tulasnella sp. 408]|nr:hypothetical protein FRC00_005250 [Tulasnella sp. 408]
MVSSKTTTDVPCHLVTGRVWLDVGVAVAFAEEVCGQLILTEYYHTATAYEGLVMPRSWIIRAFAREPSFQRNGSLAFSLVTTLEKFLKLLLLKGDPGKLQIHGKPLKEATPPARGQVVARLCRCLALIGHNIVMTKERILAIFKDIMASSDPRVRIEDQGYATACNWNEVIRALRASSPSSVLDELIVVRQKERVPGLVAGMKTVFCPDEKKLLLRLKLADYPPTIALQCETLLPNPKPGTSSSGLKAKVQRTNARVFQKEEDLQLESEAYTEEAQNAASFIQAFFRRHRRRAGGPIAIAFDELATTITQDLERSQASRDLLLCLRGPLPHVLTYLKLLHTTCLAKVNSLTEEMKNSDHERIEELRERKDGLRAIHRKVKRIIKDIHPSSEFYSQGRPEARALISGIVERVQEIPSLIIDIRGFAGCPEDTDYDLGIEPLLSERVPWAPTAATNGDHGAA